MFNITFESAPIVTSSTTKNPGPHISDALSVQITTTRKQPVHWL